MHAYSHGRVFPNVGGKKEILKSTWSLMTEKDPDWSFYMRLDAERRLSVHAMAKD